MSFSKNITSFAISILNYFPSASLPFPENLHPSSKTLDARLFVKRQKNPEKLHQLIKPYLGRITLLFSFIAWARTQNRFLNFQI